MAVLHWTMGYKGLSTKQMPETVWHKTKDISGCDQVGRKLGSIMLEHSSNQFLFRQQAGLDRNKPVRSRRRISAEPMVFKFQKEYDKKRKTKLRQIAKVQRQQREFHSHPVPNFNILHKRWERRNHKRQLVSQHKVTTAETPLTLIKSLEARKKREMKLLRLEQKQLKQQKQHQRTKLASKSYDSWRKPPFVPRIESSFVKVEPFQLVAEERGRHRRQFDERMRHEQHQRWRQKAVEWAQRWHEEYLQFRSQTNFKAQPNPCKRFRAHY